MVALQIREVPEGVRDILAERARARGQSLQSFLLSLVEDEARRSRNIELLQRFENRHDGVSEEDADAVTQALEQARAERYAELGIPGSCRADGAA